MKEMEIKILDIDRQSVEEKLLSWGASRVFDGEVTALFYDLPDGSIGRSGDVLRLRRVGDRSFITYKKFVTNEGSKVREEYETGVDDLESAQKIMESLGFVVRLEMRKHRTSYVLDGVRFELDRHTDQYSFVPEFLEIEAGTEKELYDYAGRLGYEKTDCMPWTIIEIAGHYRANQPFRP